MPIPARVVRNVMLGLLVVSLAACGSGDPAKPESTSDPKPETNIDANIDAIVTPLPTLEVQPEEIAASSLPEVVKAALLALSDSRITDAGVLVMKAQSHRTQDMNRADALARLQALVDVAATPPKPRRATKPTYASKLRRLQSKSLRSGVKTGRRSGAGDGE